MRRIRICLAFLAILAGVGIRGGSVQAGSIYTSPYVTFSPDRKAWTTDAGNTDIEWYATDGSDDVVTGVESTLRNLQSGEHYYSVQRTGAVPVARWRVHTSAVNCCHNSYPPDGTYHGVNFAMKNCFRPYFSAWRPICADCGQMIANWNFYMSKEAASSIKYLEMRETLSYYYLCPFNNNLEIGVGMGAHKCLNISANRYRVVYVANAQGETYGGYMEPSYHMYNNATEYEGKAVTPRTNLSRNNYSRIGWEFIGWNTSADGSGVFYSDGEEIFNICEADYKADNQKGSVYLYAMWRPSRSILEVDAGDGAYAGNYGITEMSGIYGESLDIDSEEIVPPRGGLITFDTCGGDVLAEIRGEKVFVEWSRQMPFHGQMLNDTYFFQGTDGSRDRITAVYENVPIILPSPTNENLSFGGWYYDKDYTKPAGGAGEMFVASKDITLYAQWVQLSLNSTENYEVNEKAGAVDLQWKQEDGLHKTYKIYQCLAGFDWKQIYEEDDIIEDLTLSVRYECEEREEFFEVPYTGFYRIEAYGAQGGDYESFTGGMGGFVQGSFWLEKGQVISCIVGGSNGYNGGGEGTVYANGGGCTMVKTQENDILLVAGGGGGAGSSGDGGAGGANVSVLPSGYDGESGGAGGGGGYLGGCAGELLVHNHVQGKCNHVHKGSSSVYGGCYTKAVYCGRELEHSYCHTERWSWGGSDELYCPNCGADATKGEECSGHERTYYDHDCPVHGKIECNRKESEPSLCPAVAGYGLSCGRTEAYICGYPYDGYIISSKPAYGGSSYVNTNLVHSYGSEAGINEGDGYILITAEDVGYRSDTLLVGVNARDMASPREIDVATIEMMPEDKNTVCVKWDKPQDLGTVYYHKAESYVAETAERLSVSNITMDTIVSDIWGYLCCVDLQAQTEVTWENAQFIQETYQSVILADAEQYIHIKAVDYAGNCSDTVHISVGDRLQGSLGVQWPLLTRQLKIEEAENIHATNELYTYYVKCDGETPVSIQYEAYIQGPASEKYQINHAVLECFGETKGNVRNTIHIPCADLAEGESIFQAQYLQFESDGDGYLQNGDYIVALRSNRCIDLKVSQDVIPTMSMHGQTVGVIPIAGADYDETVVYSDYEQDRNNMLWLVGDGEAPVIKGLEPLESLPVLDRRQQDICLQLKAEDDLSGLQEFYLKIENRDNDACATYVPDENGQITVDICADEPIFSGDIVITVYAVDNVGNEREQTYGTTEFDLQVSIERILAPHDPIFKKGESGYLHITSWGYAERIEIEFPETFLEKNPFLNHVIEYELKGSYMQEETYEFMIPLEVPEGTNYTVTVRAYKGDRMLERHPALAVLEVSGSVLDELRTRLR